MRTDVVAMWTAASLTWGMPAGLAAESGPSPAEPVVFAERSLEELLHHTARPVDSRTLRDNHEKARAELVARAPESLRYLMRSAHIRNIQIHIVIDEIVRMVDTSVVAPVLVEFLDSEYARTRKIAAYYLGYGVTPEYASAVVPLLDDDMACAAAIRTLGKWEVRAVVPRVIGFLDDDDQRRRVAAANALRDIGDDRAVPGLTGALNDPVFIVRNCAQRALQTLGQEADEMLYAASDEAPPLVLRHIIRAMGARGKPYMVEPLKSFLRRPDWGVRGDAAWALLAIDPEHATTWLSEVGMHEDRLFVTP